MSAAIRERSPERQARAIIGVAMLRTRTMIPITTSNSVSVKPRRLSGRGIDDIVFGPIEAVGARADPGEPVLLGRGGGGRGVGGGRGPGARGKRHVGPP